MREIKFRAWDEESKRMFNIARFDFADHTVYSHLFACEGHLAENLKIMQYTGIKDKNGKEIYEGDIVRHATDEGVYKVIFEDGGFYVKNLFEYDFQTINEYPLEFIGNIYENPELLEEGEE